MTIDEKRKKCCEFFEKLSDALSGSHAVLKSCNSNPDDISKYLVPFGTENEISYFGKPIGSFRISDHWNWYANVNKNPNEKYIQCLSVDMPWAKKRKAPGKPSDPIIGVQVAVVGFDGKYHAVYGEKYDKKTRKWVWLETDVAAVINAAMSMFDEDKQFCQYDCPTEGSFIGWKVVVVFKHTHRVIPNEFEYCLAQLKIPAESPRLRANNSKKCRCKYAEVLDIQKLDGESLPDDIAGYSMFELTSTFAPFYHRTIYEKGKTVYADCFDDERHNECSNGIHFFMNCEDAIAYACTWG